MTVTKASFDERNPIDLCEEIFYTKKWVFFRETNDELIAEITTKNCKYRLYFSWSEDLGAVNFTITFDLKIPKSDVLPFYELIALINEKLWIGHFDITAKNGIPAYRNTIITKNDIELYHEQFEDLIDIGIFECEKYFPSFTMVMFEGYLPLKAVEVCHLSTIGRA